MTALGLNKRNRGFTLIELMVAMTLGLFVLWVVLKIGIGQNRANAVQQQVVYAQQNVRAAMDLMARDIRGAGYDPKNSGLTPIPSASASSIQVRADLDADGGTGGTSEDVTYGEVVDPDDATKRCLTRQGQPIVYNVDPGSLQFNYGFADGGTGIPDDTDTDDTNDLDDIRRVSIRLAVQTEKPDPDTGRVRIRQLATRVRVRNIGFQDIE